MLLFSYFFFTNIPPLYVAVWLVILIIALFTLSRRKDMFFPIKIFWALVMFFAPVLGVIFYIVFGSKTANRQDNSPKR